MYLLPVFSLCKWDLVVRNLCTYLEFLSNVEEADEGNFHMNVGQYLL